MKKLFIAVLIPLFIYACSEDDTYSNPIACENNGISKGTSCECPAEYTGVHCEFFKRPRAIFIDTIAFKGFPEFNGSSQWDPDGRPDIYFYITSQSKHILSHAQYENDADPLQWYVYVPDEPLRVSSSSDILFALIDFDGPTDPGEYVDRYVSKIWDPTVGYPEKFDKHMDAGTHFILSLSYEL